MPNLVDKYRNTFLGKQANIETFQKLSSYIWVSYKFALKYVKGLNWVLWAMEHWFKALKCQLWLTNKKPFFWESDTNVETLLISSPHDGLSYKFVFKAIRSPNRISWALEYWFKVLKCQWWLMSKKLFFWESKANDEPLEKPSPYIWVSYKFVLKHFEKTGKKPSWQ